MQTVAILKTPSADLEILKAVEDFTHMTVHSDVDENVPFYLRVEGRRLQMLVTGSKGLPIEVDFLSGEWEFKIKTLGKNQLIYKAIGLDRGTTVMDATAGFGQDAFTFLLKGCQVTAIEKNPVIFLLLKNGMDRAFETKKWANLRDKLVLLNEGALNAFQNVSVAPDAIYLDPMYAEATDKSKSKKEMEFLKIFLNATDQSQSLLTAALQAAGKRVVIKRPIQSEFLYPKPTHSFKGRSTRYDMYITNNSI